MLPNFLHLLNLNSFFLIYQLRCCLKSWFLDHRFPDSYVRGVQQTEVNLICTVLEAEKQDWAKQIVFLNLNQQLRNFLQDNCLFLTSVFKCLKNRVIMKLASLWAPWKVHHALYLSWADFELFLETRDQHKVCWRQSGALTKGNQDSQQ